MSILEKLGVKLTPISSPTGEGYALSYRDDVKLSVCIIVGNDEGALTYSSATSFKQFHIEDAMRLLMENPTDSRAHAPWAFAMVGGDRVDDLMDQLNLPFEFREEARSELADLISNEKSRVKNFDHKGLDAIAKSYQQTKAAYEFYSGDNDRALIRRQAAASYPILADLLSSNLTAKMAVDRKKPIADTVINLLSKIVDASITKPVLKRLSTADTIPNGVKLSSVVRLMSLVPPDWIPTSGQDWRSFCQVAGGLFEDLAASDHSVGPMVKSAQGKWTDFCQRVVKKAGVEQANIEEDFRLVMWNTADMLEDFKNFIVLPLSAHGGDSDEVMVTPEMGIASREAAFEMLIAGKSLTDIADQQRRFHLGRNGILSGTAQIEAENRQELRRSIEANTWPGLTEPVQAPNGLWLVPLRSTIELQQEGAAMKHCVGGYTRVAETCQSFIVSVRSLDENGAIERRHSTIEFDSLNPSNDVLHVKQNMAHGNTAASPKAKDATAWYMSAILSGQVKLNRKLISAFLDDIPIPDDGIERLCGYDWKDRDTLNLAVMPWFPFVNKKYQEMNLDGLMDCEEIAPISGMISPDPVAYRFR
ncbi:PcfJ domain-containing protein [Mesorhizobium sp. SP-1A]|uniref:PcfJ domain-containing protein n=1 Tax=Mesorhizobium sp. SP-1A TaxID=3077840 RepID=UPI0028F74A80|nr:PcfJ domain-containing protein [Mesorhizobium sp. SP-1A]